MYNSPHDHQILQSIIIFVIFLFLGIGSASAWNHFQSSWNRFYQLITFCFF